MPRQLPDWAFAHGDPVVPGALRTEVDDFVVDELLDVEFTDDGEHDWLKVEKRGSNTDWIARQLARHGGVRPAEVGYSGLKDRHAVTAQWFSVWRGRGEPADWTGWTVDGARVLRIERHQRKLRRGTHSGNRFRIRVRGDAIDAGREQILARVAAIRAAGVPNYFGEQRFGRDASNLEQLLAIAAGKRSGRQQRSLAISAGRSYVFNAIVDARVRAGSWDRLMAGERANLNGSGSVFDVEEIDDALRERCSTMDIHPTATLWGKGAPLGHAAVADLETATVRNFDDLTAELAAGLDALGVEAGSRPTRLHPQDLEVEFADGAVDFVFALGSGGYATTLLREVVRTP